MVYQWWEILLIYWWSPHDLLMISKHEQNMKLVRTLLRTKLKNVAVPSFCSIIVVLRMFNLFHKKLENNQTSRKPGKINRRISYRCIILVDIIGRCLWTLFGRDFGSFPLNRPGHIGKKEIMESLLLGGNKPGRLSASKRTWNTSCSRKNSIPFFPGKQLTLTRDALFLNSRLSFCIEIMEVRRNFSPEEAYISRTEMVWSHIAAAMAQSVPPGDINTQPGTKIVFNAPYDDKHTYHIKVLLPLFIFLSFSPLSFLFHYLAFPIH